jgi:large subunit ribosomal protein L19
MNPVDIVERETRRRDLPPFRSGDTVRVHVKVREGEKERTQVFEGVVIRRRRGGASATFTVRKVSYGVGVERIFPIESPAVQKVEIKSRGHVRRSRLYYLRNLKGKRARLRSKLRDLSALISEEEAEGPLPVEEAEEASAAVAEETVAAEEATPAEAAEAAETAEPAEVAEPEEESEKS